MDTLHLDEASATQYRDVATEMSRLARVCWRLQAHRWAISVSNILAAALFVGGCIGFFWPGLYVVAVTLFLIGSLLFLFGALGMALLEHGPST
jgi:hypothetical protein